MGEITTIQLSKKMKKQLNDAKQGSESFEEVLRRLLQGYDEGIENVTRPQTAFTLRFECFNEEGEIEFENEGTITFNQLANAVVGEEFTPTKYVSAFYNAQKAVVLAKDDTICLVKFTDKNRTPAGETVDNYVVAYHFL